MFFWYVFIGPLVRGSNRYQDAKACLCHDTSAIKHEKALFLPIRGQVLHVHGKQSELGATGMKINKRKTGWLVK